MAKLTTEDLRNVAVVGHGDTGKTTMVSACLFTAGEINRLGRVEEGHTVTDFDEEEIERGFSIQTAAAHCNWNKKQITFVDTPGYAVFRSEAKASIRVADGAVLAVDAVSGAEVMTEKAWEYTRDYKIPRILVINRLDRENSSFERALESCQDVFGREVVPLQLPIGEAHEFRGVVDLLEMKAYVYEPEGSGKGKAAEIPEDMADAAQAAHDALVEMVAESDEELMESFFETGDLGGDDLRTGIRRAVRKRRLFPVYAMSATANIGTDRVLDACVEMLPSPAQRHQLVARVDGEDQWAQADSDAPFAALVFKTLSDPFAGHISLMKVFQGSVDADAHVLNARTGDDERLGNLSAPQGKELQHIDRAVAGQICAVTKLKHTATGDTLRAKGCEVVIEPSGMPMAAISFALESDSKGEEEKLSTALHRIVEEDPTLRVERDPQTHELLLSGLGQLHVEVSLSKMKRRFGVHAHLQPPKVPYRETITTRAEAEGRHKKQSGGRGQFAVASIAIEPMPRSEGFVFEDKIFGGSISQSYRPAVEKGIQEAAERGVIAGYPLVDFKVELLDGKEHSVDSSEMAFKIAGSIAFKEAVHRARPVLLEPMMHLEVTVPDDHLGDVMGDLNSRRGRVLGMDPRKGRQIVKADVPLSEVLSYAVDLNSLTGGRGSYTIEFSRYEEVPPNIAQRIVDANQKAEEAG